VQTFTSLLNAAVTVRSPAAQPRRSASRSGWPGSRAARLEHTGRAVTERSRTGRLNVAAATASHQHVTRRLAGLHGGSATVAAGASRALLCCATAATACITQA